ncbi:class I SAM-dependent methyltransferase [Microbacterium halophytorum]|uniref:class I SAM-dependent methyltransferase n=1 Tax=Microbacterium halophytorum TaxID=2067568 RepID=UPI000CFD18F1|nr:methyltransferase [Microbacterium halophytorum]
MGDHYFSEAPSSIDKPRRIRIPIAGRDVEVTTNAGVFSPDRLDTGTRVLLANTPAPPAGGDFLDIGCGWGPISLDMASASPHARVWAVDVNERALDLVRANAAELGLDNVVAVRPDEVPAGVLFRTIRSNPPIRVGKAVLHDLMESWLPRLEERSDAYLVVKRDLGSDSLQRWLGAALPEDFSVRRHATAKGYRIIKVRRHGSPRTAPIDVV